MRHTPQHYPFVQAISLCPLGVFALNDERVHRYRWGVLPKRKWNQCVARKVVGLSLFATFVVVIFDGNHAQLTATQVPIGVVNLMKHSKGYIVNALVSGGYDYGRLLILNKRESVYGRMLQLLYHAELYSI